MRRNRAFDADQSANTGANFERWAFQRRPEMEGAELVAADSALSQNRLMNYHASGRQMASQPTKDVDKGRVLPFRPSAPHSGNARLWLRNRSRSPVRDLSKFSRRPEEDNYSHRMFMNLLAFLVLSFIVGCGIWLADNMSERNKDQDCGWISRTYCGPNTGASEIR
jgi:hypothetical protein